MKHDDFKLTKNTYERRAHEVVKPSELFEGENSSLRKTFEETLDPKRMKEISKEWNELDKAMTNTNTNTESVDVHEKIPTNEEMVYELVATVRVPSPLNEDKVLSLFDFAFDESQDDEGILLANRILALLTTKDAEHQDAIATRSERRRLVETIRAEERAKVDAEIAEAVKAERERIREELESWGGIGWSADDYANETKALIKALDQLLDNLK